MFSDVIEAAVITLQRRAMHTRDSYDLERSERAIDELLRDPENPSGSARHRIRSARGHAYEVLERRKAIAPRAIMHAGMTEPSCTEHSFSRTEWLDWIRTEPTFNLIDRTILHSLAVGEDAETLAARHNLPLPRMRQRISRARRVAREARANLDLIE
ncbi:hypothetical protein [Streptomyces aidingensis]|uniref:Uncharacterized protein n=1 Tax=Streptomyces aidingensis TaxID=910347 RepID=A0A1I1KH00_9ACTN|nr:hypothetical protein [Streptomyces aidingensis]SFC60096.1 hypothetical protein SAMN05421773_104233 [Streptomyces aidingensis]